MNNNLIAFIAFISIILSVSAVSFAFNDFSTNNTKNKSVGCACMSNTCDLVGFALDIHNNYCNNSPLTSIKLIFSYIVVPNVTCSIARDCFYNSMLMGCEDMFDYDARISGWCCYDNCKLFHYKHDEDVY